MSIYVEPYTQGCWGIIILDLFILEVYYIFIVIFYLIPSERTGNAGSFPISRDETDEAAVRH